MPEKALERLLSSIQTDPPQAQIERILATAREFLDMQMAFVGQFKEGRQIYRFVEGEEDPKSPPLGGSRPLDDTYCQLVVNEQLPTLVPDAKADELVRDLQVTRDLDIGAYVGVPIHFSDGRLYGTLCCLSHVPEPTLRDRDVTFMKVLARLIGNQVERQELDEELRRQEVERLQSILGGDGLSIVFQPIFELDSEKVSGFEALSRFAFEPYRTPDRWYEDAWRLGMGVDLELFAIEAALSELDRLPPPFYVSVNASPETVLSSRFTRVIGEFPPERVIIEITEHAHIDDYDAINNTLDKIRGMGVRLAIDDVGAGYAGLHHILRLAPDVFKLDFVLTRDVDTELPRQALASAATAFGQQIGAMIVAEGVETKAELKMLRSLGVRFAQGYLLGRPAPLEDAGPPPFPDLS